MAAIRRVLVSLIFFSVAVLGAATPAVAYGGGATHDTWQMAISGNCDNVKVCGADQLGGFWGWVEFDRTADGAITGDAEFAGCGHVVMGGGPGLAGAFHASVDITKAHLVPAGSGAPNPGGTSFYVDHNTVTYTGKTGTVSVTDDPGFLGDTDTPGEAGHYALHLAPGVSEMINVTFRAAR